MLSVFYKELKPEKPKIMEFLTDREKLENPFHHTQSKRREPPEGRITSTGEERQGQRPELWKWLHFTREKEVGREKGPGSLTDKCLTDREIYRLFEHSAIHVIPNGSPCDLK